MDCREVPHMKQTQTQQEIETEIKRKYSDKQKLGILFKGSGKMFEGSAASRNMARQAHNQGQQCKPAPSSTAKKANNVIKSNQTRAPPGE